MSAAEAPLQCQRRDTALVLAGALTLPAIAKAWQQARPLLPGATQLDLAAVSQVDSAGLAFLALLCQEQPGLALVGQPAGLAALCRAYRLDAQRLVPLP